MKYLTPEDFEIAKENGISEELAKYRFYYRKWDKERSITQPPRTGDLWPKYKDICVVSMNQFHKRIRNGMTPEQAATTPKQKPGRKNTGRVTKEMIETAEKNGISLYALNNRIYSHKWAPEKAVSTPEKKRGARV